MPTQWIQFRLIEKPYYNRHGSVLSSIDNRKNARGRDDFSGGGKVYPATKNLKIIERHENGDSLLLLVEGEQADIDALATSKSVTYATSPITLKTVSEGFQPQALSEVEAAGIKREMFGIIKGGSESGVTK